MSSEVKRYYISMVGNLVCLKEMTPEYAAETGFAGLIKGEDYAALEAENARLQSAFDELAERYGKLQTGEDSLLAKVVTERDAARAQIAALQDGWPKLSEAAKVGAIRFQPGVSSRLVIEAAQRLHRFEVTPEKEAARIRRLDVIRAGVLNDAVDDALDWLDCQKIAELDSVDEALRTFSADSTLDNATALVKAIRKAGEK